MSSASRVVNRRPDKFRTVIGVVVLVLFAVSGAVRDVTVDQYFTNKRHVPDSAFLTFFSSLIAFIVFYIALSIRRRAIYKFDDWSALSKSSRSAIAALNVGNIVVIICTILAVRTLSAFCANLGDAIAVPISTAIFAVVLRRERTTKIKIAGFVIALIGVTVLLATTDASKHVKDSEHASTAAGVMFLVIGSIAFALNQVWGKNLVEIGLTREKLMVFRFPAAILLCGLAGILTRPSLPEDPAIWIAYIAIALGGVALPLFLLVYAFEYIGVKEVAGIMLLTPLFVAVGTMLENGKLGSNPMVAAICGIVIVAGVMTSEFA